MSKSDSETSRKKYVRTEHPNIYRYEGRLKTSFAASFKGRFITCRTLEDAVHALSTMNLHGRDAHISTVRQASGLEVVNVRDILKRIRSRAAAAGIEMLLTEDDLETMKARTNGQCELTGIRFSDEKPLGKRFRPWMPSVDRIRCTLPYQLSNCRIVCAYVNLAINDLGEDEFYKLASMFVKAHKRRSRGASL